MKCSCCNESIYEFLTIDHISNNGGEHRKSIRKKYIYQWLIENNFPSGFRVLCMNCNWGRMINHGICPHEKSKSISMPSPLEDPDISYKYLNG